MDEQVPEDVKTERLHVLQALLEDQRQAFNRSCVGRVMNVLFDRTGRHPGQVAGRSPFLQPVQTEARGIQIGDVVAMRITGNGTNSLFGEPVDEVMEAVA
jgi:tRNA-2-methylthio-N6-dimethylallyladenosine synthase